MTEYDELKKASPEVKHQKVKDLIKQIQHMTNMWEEKEQGWEMYYSYGHRAYSARIRDFLESCPESKEKLEVLDLLDKLDKVHRGFVERMSNH